MATAVDFTTQDLHSVYLQRRVDGGSSVQPSDVPLTAHCARSASGLINCGLGLFQ